MTDRVQDFPAMLRTVLGDRLAPEAETFVDMLAEDAVMEFPFAPEGLPKRSEGRAAVAEHLQRLARLISFDRIGQASVLAQDGETTVLTFEAVGRGLLSGAAYDQSYLSVIDVRDGRIVRYRDFWNPLAVVRAVLGDSAVDALDLSEAYDG